MPDATLSEAIKEAYAIAPSNAVILHTLEIRHPNFLAPIRVVRDYQDLSARLEDSAPENAGETVEFIAFAFDIKPPDSTSDGIPTCVIEMDNVSQEILANVDRAMFSQQQITVIYRAYLSNDLSGPQNDPPLTMNLLSVEANLMRVRATAGFTNIANRKFPASYYSLTRFPGLVLQG
jgi:hypothetical protein